MNEWQIILLGISIVVISSIIIKHNSRSMEDKLRTKFHKEKIPEHIVHLGLTEYKRVQRNIKDNKAAYKHTVDYVNKLYFIRKP